MKKKIIEKIKKVGVIIAAYLLSIIVLLGTGDGYMEVRVFLFMGATGYAIYKVIEALFTRSKSRKNIQANPKLRDRWLNGDDNVDYYQEFRVAGVTHDNDDGSSRQRYIRKYVHDVNPAYLHILTYDGELACQVFADEDHKKCIGWIAKDEVYDLLQIIDGNPSFCPIFSAKLGGDPDHPSFGVRVAILEEDV